MHPTMGISRDNVGTKVWTALREARAAARYADSGLVLDMAPRGCQPGEATGFTPTLMGYSRYMACFENILMMPPLSLTPQLASNVVTYRARRLLPSVMQFSGSERPRR